MDCYPNQNSLTNGLQEWNWPHSKFLIHFKMSSSVRGILGNFLISRIFIQIWFTLCTWFYLLYSTIFWWLIIARIQLLLLEKILILHQRWKFALHMSTEETTKFLEKDQFQVLFVLCWFHEIFIYIHFDGLIKLTKFLYFYVLTHIHLF